MLAAADGVVVPAEGSIPKAGAMPRLPGETAETRGKRTIEMQAGLMARGDRVARGQPIARLGDSGNSTEPHLHFHVTDGADPILSAGVPVRFHNIEIQFSDGTRTVQSGDIVETRREMR